MTPAGDVLDAVVEDDNEPVDADDDDIGDGSHFDSFLDAWQ